MIDEYFVLLNSIIVNCLLFIPERSELAITFIKATARCVGIDFPDTDAFVANGIAL